MKKRLQKILAEAGVSSRRQAERLIRDGRVLLNSAPAVLGMQADPFSDSITLDGKPVTLPEEKVYFLFNKPAGCLSTVSDSRGRPKVTDFFRSVPARVFPVGRLDYDTEGLLIVTNDGDFAHALLHPSFEVDKVYHARVEGTPGPDALRLLAKGVPLDDGVTAPATVRVLEKGGRSTLLEITIHEGRKRQVKRMCEFIGHPVFHLKRVSVGSLSLGGLPAGSFRPLTPEEIEALRG
jgi:pseudouridine synthase